MSLVTLFSTPGNVIDSAPDAWHGRVMEEVEPLAARFPQFYDPVVEDTPADAQVAAVVWFAFPASIEGASDLEKLQKADSARRFQDEYCEWAVERSDGKVTRVTFTSEVPEYWEHLFLTDPDTLLDLYQGLVDPGVQPGDLERNGGYVRANRWNDSTSGRPAHLIQQSNSLHAAFVLAAEATVLREDRNGQPVTDRQRLVACGGLGNPNRNSDPQIADAVNRAAAQGAEITLGDPPGLYIDGLGTGGMATPDGADPLDFWTVERGDDDHVLRAAFEVPADRGYAVGDIEINGQPIEFGGQLARRVRVRLEAVVKPGSHRPERQPCVQ